jgi:hypothetical protein
MTKTIPKLRSLGAGAIIVFLVFGLVLEGCGPKAGKDRSGEQEVRDFTRRVNKIIRPEETVWPEDVPEGVPEFTQGRIVSTQKGLTADGTSWTISVAGVEEGGFDAYLESLRDAGWEATLARTDDGGVVSAATESLDLRLTFNGDHGTLVVRMKMF